MGTRELSDVITEAVPYDGPHTADTVEKAAQPSCARHLAPEKQRRRMITLAMVTVTGGITTTTSAAL